MTTTDTQREDDMNDTRLRRQDINEFVRDTCDALDDMEPYERLHYRIRKSRYGGFRGPLMLSGLIMLLLPLRIIVAVIAGWSIGQPFMIVWLCATGFFVAVRLCVPWLRKRRGLTDDELELTMEAARDVGQRLESELPKSPLLERWSELS